eukprot:1686618-Amphidinium_carterae.1
MQPDGRMVAWLRCMVAWLHDLHATPDYSQNNELGETILDFHVILASMSTLAYNCKERLLTWTVEPMFPGGGHALQRADI